MKKIASVIVICFFFIVTEVGAQTNLFKNGDFEDDLTGWNGNAATITPYAVKNGKSSCAISSFNNSEWMGIDQVAYLPKKAVAIEFSIWVQASAIQPGKDAWNAGIVNVEFMSGSSRVGETQSIAKLLGSAPWKLYKQIMKVPVGAKSVRVMMALGNVSGTMVFDDVKARPITQEELDKEAAAVNAATEAASAELKNGGFENGNEAWNGQGEISKIAHSGSNAYVLKNDAAVWSATEQTIGILKTTKSIDVSAWIKTENIIQGKDVWNVAALIIGFSNANGQKAGEDVTITTVSGTQDWKHYSKTIPVPEGAKTARVMVAINAGTGTCYIDDILIKAIQ